MPSTSVRFEFNTNAYSIVLWALQKTFPKRDTDRSFVHGLYSSIRFGEIFAEPLLKVQTTKRKQHSAKTSQGKLFRCLNGP